MLNSITERIGFGGQPKIVLGVSDTAFSTSTANPQDDKNLMKHNNSVLVPS